jgi:hypothetical protein
MRDGMFAVEPCYGRRHSSCLHVRGGRFGRQRREARSGEVGQIYAVSLPAFPSKVSCSLVRSLSIGAAM